MKRFVGYGLVASVGFTVLGLGFAYDAQLSNAFYTIAAFGYIVFGIWAAVLLLKK